MPLNQPCPCNRCSHACFPTRRTVEWGASASCASATHSRRRRVADGRWTSPRRGMVTRPPASTAPLPPHCQRSSLRSSTSTAPCWSLTTLARAALTSSILHRGARTARWSRVRGRSGSAAFSSAMQAWPSLPRRCARSSSRGYETTPPMAPSSSPPPTP